VLRLGRDYTTITVSYEVWAELVRRKALLAAKKKGRVSFDDVIKELLRNEEEEYKD